MTLVLPKIPRVCFVDTETTGLDADRHQIWEVGLITPGGYHHHWFLPVDLTTADPVALDIGEFHRRHPQGFYYLPLPEDPDVTDPAVFAKEFSKLTWDHQLAGAVVSFDEERLRRLLRREGQVPGWHYHLIDVEALAAGWLRARGEALEQALPPWNSNELSKALGVDPGRFHRHTAIGDCGWAMALYETVMAEPTSEGTGKRKRIRST